MQQKVTGEAVIKVLTDQVMIGPSESGYTLCYGVTKDGDFTEYSTPVPAGENCIVNGVMKFSYIKLKDNTGDVNVIL